ncbi:hypothetical protein [Telmatospirillum siberiense]|uniref:Uncharacterized protein n=1 Tax=Telmatospirillum siberiense TaxID=382514 RepID=A0A2N3PWD0_9PROT|nr:hypothetical protein [Telmatospirillum siberiense]PKU24716.1 hypothetical protein CWS72_10305 [Telmatospirillum siberiense]
MLPLLPFAAGLAAGIFGIRLLKGVKAADYRDVNAAARERLDRARNNVRQAAVAGLSAVEHSSASLRAKLTPEAVPEAAANPDPTAKRTRNARRVKPQDSIEAKPARRKRVPKAAAPKTTDDPS